MIDKTVHEPKTKSDKTPAQKPPAHRVKTLTIITAISCALTVACMAFALLNITSTQAELDKLQAQTIPVVVSTQPIESGATITPESVRIEHIPSTFAVEGALSTPDEVIGKVASAHISQNAQVSTNLIAGRLGAHTLALAIAPEMVAIAVSVDAQTGIAGLLRQGDFIDILAEGAPIVGNVRVLALDSSLSDSAGEYATVTLEVSIEEAGVIQNAQTVADVRLVLHSDANKDVPSTQEVA